MAEAASVVVAASHSFTPDGQYRIDGSDLGLLGAGAHGTCACTARHIGVRRPRHQPRQASARRRPASSALRAPTDASP